MIKKLKAVKADVAKQDIVKQVRANARDVWLAGLGAFAAMQSGSGRMIATAQSESAKVFNTLVKQGKEVEAQAKKTALKQAENVSDKTSQAIDKLEQVFQERVSRSLSRLGVPSSDDVKVLTSRVEELTGNVQALVARKPARPVARKSARA